MTDYDQMSREELIAELKRLRLQEFDIRAEGHRWVTATVAPILGELEIVRQHLMLKAQAAKPEAPRPDRYAS
jgi:hypothetical protein